jgi:two-component system, LytTR family, response regulator
VGNLHNRDRRRPLTSAMKIRVMIVDDERLARSQMRLLLARHEGVAVVGEADGVATALVAVERCQPDVVFLDIQMPGLSGFDFLERTERAFKTIFVTAYDEFALRAFAVNALDYLLKPVEPERLANALNRLSSLLKGTLPATRPAQLGLQNSDHIFVTSGPRARFIPVNSIKAICSAGAYSEIRTADDRRWMILRGLKEWEELLPAPNFVRIHRSTIVNLCFVERVESLENYSYRVFLGGGSSSFTMSRRYAIQLKNRFG